MKAYRLDVLTLFPKSFDSFFEYGVIGRSFSKGIAELNLFNPRDFTIDSYHKVDDEPYGGGVGMVLKPEPFFEAFDAVPFSKKRRVLMMSPQGKQLSQEDLWRWSNDYDHLVFICGQYEGFDERIRSLADEEISIGDFVLTGGELAAMSIINGVVRLLPGTLGSAESLIEESYADFLLEHPQYTRPAIFRNLEVPEVLRGGDHLAIAKWRQLQREMRTKERRPDLYDRWIEKKISDKNSKNFWNHNSLDVGFGEQCDDFTKDPWWN